MNLIKKLIDYEKEYSLKDGIIWATYNALNEPRRVMKPTSVDDYKIVWKGWDWSINFQYALKIVFEDGMEMVFKGGAPARAKVNDEGMDLVTFMEEYIANNYEIPHNNEVFISDDEDMIV